MGFSPVDDERARAGFVVFQSLLRWTDVDLLTLWWVTRSASWLSRTGAGGVCLAVTVAARLLRRRA